MAKRTKPRSWQDGFPAAFRKHRKFATLVQRVEALHKHKALRIPTQHCLDNMIRASLLFTVCFYGNLKSALNKYLNQRRPFAVLEDTTLMGLLMDLARGELADNYVSHRKTVTTPHYVMMLDAAKEAEVDVAKIEALVMQASFGSTSATWVHTTKPSTEVTEYMNWSEAQTELFSTSFATIAVRELILGSCFKVISHHLPTAARFDHYRRFLMLHVETDTKQHGPLITRALQTIGDHEFMLDVMIDFCEHRKKVYDACLREESIL